MNFYTPRKLKFKAWDNEARLLIRLNSLECLRGELVKKNHILLQFTGVLDKQGEELYECDVILVGSEQHIIVWNSETNGWSMQRLDGDHHVIALLASVAQTSTRLWNYFESARD